MDSFDEATVIESDSVTARSVPAETSVTWRELSVGRYVLVKPIGRGSFGSVWAAFDPELDRKVAVKIVYLRGQSGGSTRTGGSSRGLLPYDEVLSEAQLPAQLSHPNIVAIHDVGWIEAETLAELGDAGSLGRSLYVVMEYLGGRTLRGWLGEKERTWREIVAVLVRAGRGLEAAHAKGVVHLDFKPGNLMFGDEGRPRVLDFGLARVRRRRPASESGSMPVAGTPGYMAPEQHAGQDSDERADQYAFAITLWEALWGARPFKADGPGSMMRLHELKLAGPPAPPRTGSVPAHVRNALTRALAPAREDRFPTLAALLSALEADPREVRRRWLTGLVFVAGMVALGVGASQTRDPCDLPSDRFVGIWDEAVAGEIDASFTGVGVEGAEAIMAKVRAGLDRQVARWTEVRGQVCSTGTMGGGRPLEVMSEEFLCLDAHLLRVEALTQRLRTAEPETIARAAESVAHLRDPEDCLQARRGRVERVLDEETRAQLLAAQQSIAQMEVELPLGHYELALASADEALARAEPLDDPRLRGEIHLLRGRTLVKLGRYDDATAALLEALAAAERAGDELLVARISVTQISNETEASRFPRAELIADLTSTRLASGRVEEPKLAIDVDVVMSQLYLRQRRYDESLARAEQGHARQRELDPDDEGQAAVFHLLLGNIATESRTDLVGARAHYEAALELWSRAYGPIHPQVGAMWLNLGAIEFRAGAFEQALANFEAAAGIFAQVYPLSHPHIGMINQNIAAVHMLMGHYLEAVEPNEAALAMYEAAAGRESVKYAGAELNHAGLMASLGRHRDSMRLGQHVSEVFAAQLEPGDARHLLAQSTLIGALWSLGRGAEARAAVAEVEGLMTKIDAEEPRRMIGLFVVADARLREGRGEEALVLGEQLMAMIESGQLSEPDLIAQCGALLGRIMLELGEVDGARRRLEALSRAHFDTPKGQPLPASWQLQLARGHVERAAGQTQRARALYESAWKLLGGYTRVPVFGAEIDLALASIEAADEAARRRAKRALELLREQDVRPDLQAEAEARLVGEAAPSL